MTLTEWTQQTKMQAVKVQEWVKSGKLPQEMSEAMWWWAWKHQEQGTEPK